MKRQIIGVFCLMLFVTSLTMAQDGRRKVKYKLATDGKLVQITLDGDGPALQNLLGKVGSSTQDLDRMLNAKNEDGTFRLPGATRVAVELRKSGRIVVVPDDKIQKRLGKGAEQWADYATFGHTIWIPIINQYIPHVLLVPDDKKMGIKEQTVAPIKKPNLDRSTASRSSGYNYKSAS